jgi:hypothetical protein
MWPIDRPPRWVGRRQEPATLRAGVAPDHPGLRGGYQPAHRGPDRPAHSVGDPTAAAEPDPPADPAGPIRARIDGSPLTAAAVLAWSGDLPRLLQQVLFDTADSIVF